MKKFFGIILIVFSVVSVAENKFTNTPKDGIREQETVLTRMLSAGDLDRVAACRFGDHDTDGYFGPYWHCDPPVLIPRDRDREMIFSGPIHKDRGEFYGARMSSRYTPYGGAFLNSMSFLLGDPTLLLVGFGLILYRE